MNLFGVAELTTARTARRREKEMTRLRLAAADGPATTGFRGPTRDLIALADYVDDLLDGESADRTALIGIRRRVDALLALCGVAPVTDDGAVDFLRHQIVAEEPPPTPALADHIASTVRPGYQRGDDLLRAQQVVAYRGEPVVPTS